ncbi:hypothetical protein QBC46DRAFT_375674 [Diplogelasinospora grovesii]|uniref:Homeobox domain-containing protein n=1 Tax=Diplogelasinospora grovesii TaxID=303347 RepID=A0AAN6NDT4_9PEZI|nr:hypothetical protein QBC46DRAFT_375674 [Diplogelasinospora grovesii]
MKSHGGTRSFSGEESSLPCFRFTQEQIQFLKTKFAHKEYPDRADTKHISQQTGLAIGQVQVWFANQ